MFFSESLFAEQAEALAAKPPSTADKRRAHSEHLAKRNRQAAKLEEEVAAMRAEIAVRANLAATMNTRQAKAELDASAMGSKTGDGRQQADDACGGSSFRGMDEEEDAETALAADHTKEVARLKKLHLSEPMVSGAASHGAAKGLQQLLLPRKHHCFVVGQLDMLFQRAWRSAILAGSETSVRSAPACVAAAAATTVTQQQLTLVASSEKTEQQLEALNNGGGSLFVHALRAGLEQQVRSLAARRSQRQEEAAAFREAVLWKKLAGRGVSGLDEKKEENRKEREMQQQPPPSVKVFSVKPWMQDAENHLRIRCLNSVGGFKTANGDDAGDDCDGEGNKGEAGGDQVDEGWGEWDEWKGGYSLADEKAVSTTTTTTEATAATKPSTCPLFAPSREEATVLSTALREPLCPLHLPLRDTPLAYPTPYVSRWALQTQPPHSKLLGSSEKTGFRKKLASSLNSAGGVSTNTHDGNRNTDSSKNSCNYYNGLPSVYDQDRSAPLHAYFVMVQGEAREKERAAALRAAAKLEEQERGLMAVGESESASLCADILLTKQEEDWRGEGAARSRLQVQEEEKERARIKLTREMGKKANGAMVAALLFRGKKKKSKEKIKKVQIKGRTVDAEKDKKGNGDALGHTRNEAENESKKPEKKYKLDNNRRKGGWFRNLFGKRGTKRNHEGPNVHSNSNSDSASIMVAAATETNDDLQINGGRESNNNNLNLEDEMGEKGEKGEDENSLPMATSERVLECAFEVGPAGAEQAASNTTTTRPMGFLLNPSGVVAKVNADSQASRLGLAPGWRLSHIAAPILPSPSTGATLEQASFLVAEDSDYFDSPELLSSSKSSSKSENVQFAALDPRENHVVAFRESVELAKRVQMSTQVEIKERKGRHEEGDEENGAALVPLGEVEKAVVVAAHVVVRFREDKKLVALAEAAARQAATDAVAAFEAQEVKELEEEHVRRRADGGGGGVSGRVSISRGEQQVILDNLHQHTSEKRRQAIKAAVNAAVTTAMMKSGRSDTGSGCSDDTIHGAECDASDEPEEINMGRDADECEEATQHEKANTSADEQKDEKKRNKEVEETKKVVFMEVEELRRQQARALVSASMAQALRYHNYGDAFEGYGGGGAAGLWVFRRTLFRHLRGETVVNPEMRLTGVVHRQDAVATVLAVASSPVAAADQGLFLGSAEFEASRGFSCPLESEWRAAAADRKGKYTGQERARAVGEADELSKQVSAANALAAHQRSYRLLCGSLLCPGGPRSVQLKFECCRQVRRAARVKEADARQFVAERWAARLLKIQKEETVEEGGPAYGGADASAGSSAAAVAAAAAAAEADTLSHDSCAIASSNGDFTSVAATCGSTVAARAPNATDSWGLGVDWLQDWHEIGPHNAGSSRNTELENGQDQQQHNFSVPESVAATAYWLLRFLKAPLSRPPLSVSVRTNASGSTLASREISQATALPAASSLAAAAELRVIDEHGGSNCNSEREDVGDDTGSLDSDCSSHTSSTSVLSDSNNCSGARKVNKNKKRSKKKALKAALGQRQTAAANQAVKAHRRVAVKARKTQQPLNSAVSQSTFMLWRAQLACADDQDGDHNRAYAQLEAELARVRATVTCAHPRHLVGSTCVNCALMQPTNEQRKQHEDLVQSQQQAQQQQQQQQQRKKEEQRQKQNRKKHVIEENDLRGTDGWFSSSLVTGVRKVYTTTQVSNFCESSILARRRRGRDLRTQAAATRQKMVGRAVSFLQQAWRLHSLAAGRRHGHGALVSTLGQLKRLELSKEYFRLRRWERLIRDVRFGDLGRGPPSPDSPANLRLHERCPQTGPQVATAVSRLCQAARDEPELFYSVPGVGCVRRASAWFLHSFAVEERRRRLLESMAAVAAAVANEKKKEKEQAKKKQAKDEVGNGSSVKDSRDGVSSSGRSSPQGSVLFALGGTEEEGEKRSGGGSGATATEGTAAAATDVSCDNDNLGSGDDDTDHHGDNNLPVAADVDTKTGQTQKRYSFEFLWRRYGSDLAFQLDSMARLEAKRGLRAARRLVLRFVARFRAKEKARELQQAEAERVASVDVARKLEARQFAELREAKAGGQSLEEHRLKVKKEEYEAAKHQIVVRLSELKDAGKAQGASSSAEEVRWVCNRPQCRVAWPLAGGKAQEKKKKQDKNKFGGLGDAPKRKGDGSDGSEDSDDGEKEKRFPLVFVDGQRWQMHMRLHANEERAATEAERTKLLALQAKVDKEKAFLGQLRAARFQRKESEAKWEAASRAVEAEEYAETACDTSAATGVEVGKHFGEACQEDEEVGAGVSGASFLSPTVAGPSRFPSQKRGRGGGGRDDEALASFFAAAVAADDDGDDDDDDDDDDAKHGECVGNDVLNQGGARRKAETHLLTNGVVSFSNAPLNPPAPLEKQRCSSSGGGRAEDGNASDDSNDGDDDGEEWEAQRMHREMRRRQGGLQDGSGSGCGREACLIEKVPACLVGARRQVVNGHRRHRDGARRSRGEEGSESPAMVACNNLELREEKERLRQRLQVGLLPPPPSSSTPSPSLPPPSARNEEEREGNQLEALQTILNSDPKNKNQTSHSHQHLGEVSPGTLQLERPLDHLAHFNACDLPWLDLVHSASLPVNDGHDGGCGGGDHGSVGNGSNGGGGELSSSLLGGKVVLRHAVNRIGRGVECNATCVEGSLNRLRGDIGLAAEEVASQFTSVHAIVRVDPCIKESTSTSDSSDGGGLNLSEGKEGVAASFVGNGVDYGGSGAFSVSVFDNFAATSSSSQQSPQQAKHGVWVLGLNGLRPAPKPSEIHTKEGREAARLRDGDKILISMRRSSSSSRAPSSFAPPVYSRQRSRQRRHRGGQAAAADDDDEATYHSSFHLVYELRIPNAKSRLKSAAKAITNQRTPWQQKQLPRRRDDTPSSKVATKRDTGTSNVSGVGVGSSSSSSKIVLASGVSNSNKRNPRSGAGLSDSGISVGPVSGGSGSSLNRRRTSEAAAVAATQAAAQLSREDGTAAKSVSLAAAAAAAASASASPASRGVGGSGGRATPFVSNNTVAKKTATKAAAADDSLDSLLLKGDSSSSSSSSRDLRQDQQQHQHQRPAAELGRPRKY